MLHLPAIAKECGVALNLDIANEISAKTPNLCHLAPAGRTYMEDLNAAGGVYAVMKELADIAIANDLLVISDDGTIIRMDCGSISVYGRATQGVRIMRVSDGCRVISIARTEKEEESDTEAASSEEAEEE